MRTLRKNSKEFKETLNKILTIEELPLTYQDYNDDFALRLKAEDGTKWLYSRNNISIVKVTAEEMVGKENYLDRNSYFKNSIYDAYVRPSFIKVSTFNTLEKLYKDWDNTKITGYCINSYTYCASKTLSDGVMLFAKETSCNSYLTIYVTE